jgi:hypothetical protein
VREGKFEKDIKPILRKKGIAIGAFIETQIEQNGFIYQKEDDGSDIFTNSPLL